MTKVLEAVDVALSYGALPVLAGVSLDLAPGELHVLLGASGSGKSSLLRALAGLERLSSGRLRLDARVVDDASAGVFVPTELRRVGMVFQDYALFPHLDVRGNVAYGVRGDAAQRRSEALAWIEQVGLQGLETRRVDALSGGQQQRVALARALAARPALLLMDEPFSNVDRSLRRQLCDTTKTFLRGLGMGVVLVTHDVEEAFWVADRVSVLGGGSLHQTDTPEALYSRPKTWSVAKATGSVQELGGHILPGGDRAATPWGEVRLRSVSGDRLIARPEDATLFPPTAAPAHAVLASVEAKVWLGAEVLVRVRSEQGALLEVRCRPGQVPAGDHVAVWVEQAVAVQA